jgi:hypothetical protein
MYIKYDYCKTSIEHLFSEYGNDYFRITIHIVRLTWSYINHLLYNISVCGIWSNIYSEIIISPNVFVFLLSWCF